MRNGPLFNPRFPRLLTISEASDLHAQKVHWDWLRHHMCSNIFMRRAHEEQDMRNRKHVQRTIAPAMGFLGHQNHKVKPTPVTHILTPSFAPPPGCHCSKFLQNGSSFCFRSRTERLSSGKSVSCGPDWQQQLSKPTLFNVHLLIREGCKNMI